MNIDLNSPHNSTPVPQPESGELLQRPALDDEIALTAGELVILWDTRF
jgi:hypothetical protein